MKFIQQKLKLLFLFALVVMLTGKGFPAATVPRIDSVTHNGFGTLMPGDTLTVTLRGESGGTATFDITNVTTEAPMQEIYPGVYQGSYTIVNPQEIPFASVTGHLRKYGEEARLVAVKSVSIGENIAQINPMLQLTPVPGFQSTSLRPRISVTFQNPIQPSTVDLVVDGIDYTPQVRITPHSVDWIPPFDLSAGEHEVILWAMDTQGEQLRREWNFYVGNPSAAALIQSAVETPRTVKVGQTVSVTVQGTPGGTAAMSLENGPDILMTEGPSGIYTGSYVVPSQWQGRYAYLTVKLQTPNGSTETLNDADVVYVARAAEGDVPLDITGPFGGSQVTRTFVVSGNTEPYATVMIHLWAPDSSGVWQEIAGPQVRADRAGHFAAHINSGNKPSGTNMTILVQAKNDQGRQSDVFRIELTRQ